MRRTIIVAAFALFAFPGSALAADTTAEATAACKAEKHQTGTGVFRKTYAAKSTAKAMKACVAARGPAVAAAAKNAAQECKSLRTDDLATFEATYGTKRNAFGKCVSSNARETVEEETADRVNAATTCKALRTDDKATFEGTYGTKKNAFGKCVSATAKASGEDA